MKDHHYLAYASLSAFGAGMSGMAALTNTLINVSKYANLEAVILQSKIQEGRNTATGDYQSMLEEFTFYFADNPEYLSFSMLVGGLAATLSVLSLYFLKKSD